MKLTGLLAASLMAATRLSATTNGSAVDVSNYTGEALLVLNSSATEAADNTADFKLQHCDTAGGAYVDAGITFDQVTNAAASHQVQRVTVDGLKKYVRVVSTLGGTTPHVTASVELIGTPQ